MTNPKKKCLQAALWVAVLVILIATILLNVSVAGRPVFAGGCISVTFDKWDMMRADKVIIHFDGKQYTVTDTKFIRDLCKETLAGTLSSYCCSDFDDGWIKIYRGDRLIRRMRYIENHEAFAYEADPAHWVLFGDESHAFLSKQTWEQLRAIIGNDSLM